MARYLSDAALAWHAANLAGQAWDISCHTAEPGTDGLNAEVTAAGGSNYRRFRLAAAATTADAVAAGKAAVDNNAELALYVPNAAAAGVTIKFLGLWRDPTGANEWYGWVSVPDYLTVVGEPVRIPAGALDMTAERPA